MIEKHDGEFEMLRGNPPQWITFHNNGAEVGRLNFGPPMTFEGDIEECAELFFEHVVKHNNDVIHQYQRLLEAAKCPDPDCDGEGTCCAMVPGYDGEGDIDVWQCQWCHERKVLLGGDDQ